ncbi:plasmid recombination protein [Limimaricola cinnabarinus]|uniref:plasmid recombination protein n=1 Tax=Limimaricola cinnabarinus TaxID=1125964 RepID=UPI00249386C8|nr:plasmid recombination protein [Limimaricola cinnabarinus]
MDGSNIKTDYPVVLRFEGLYPHQLGGYEAHRLRKGGDLGHVYRSRSGLNQRLIGSEDWAARALAEIDEMKIENFAAELASLEKRNRKKDIERRMLEGPKQPWRATRHGPMREVILTVNKDWFDADLAGFFGEGENQREKEFGEFAKEWLIENFGEDVIHARADRDEAAFHVHAVIMPRATVEIAKPNAKVPAASATRRMLQPSIHPLIKDYEAAQDSVGQWFADLGLVRGERRAEAIRQARQNGVTPPKRRYHAKTWKWRAEEEQRLLAEMKALAERTAWVEVREEEAETVLAVAEGVATGAFVAKASSEAPELEDGPPADPARPAGPGLEELRRRSPRGFARAASAFSRAWSRLFGDAQAEAEATARRGVSAALTEIAEADEKIAEAAMLLPKEKRPAIAAIRRTIPAILRRLERGVVRYPAGAKLTDQPPGGAAGEKSFND